MRRFCRPTFRLSRTGAAGVTASIAPGGCPDGFSRA
ncbi:hypothetical protein M2283_007106 [Streptomyces pseudovenezuelae]|uniref:Uncharacterized protein n=1 Tax=Streptomyces pseudovenezuelae TaxID=67350 RepID=A0ABT6LTZ2_9ACTN|nr:hypothetical protein [Streptomyces pseudovenezuelae]